MRIANTHSESLCISNGVPQESVLVPLLFLFYINDLPANILSSIQIFADYAKIKRTIRSTCNRACLQNELDRINEWAENSKVSPADS
ncbi:unnamed protein product, partial [Dicrocoelium dendriticum]